MISIISIIIIRIVISLLLLCFDLATNAARQDWIACVGLRRVLIIAGCGMRMYVCMYG